MAFRAGLRSREPNESISWTQSELTPKVAQVGQQGICRETKFPEKIRGAWKLLLLPYAQRLKSRPCLRESLMLSGPPVPAWSALRHARCPGLGHSLSRYETDSALVYFDDVTGTARV